MSTPAVELRAVSKRFGEVRAVSEVSLSVQKGEFFSLLGPSGCGKSTLLRMIAGLEWPDSGVVCLGSTEMHATPAHLRPVNTVFQSYALFPHMNVETNIAFGLRMKRVPRGVREDRVARAMETVRIVELAGRRPSELSGGQRQRVALARAIVNEPEVLLLDEPLGALDLQLRKQLQVELKSVQRKLGMTFIHVTHDQEEALVLSDRIGLMQAGRLVQVDSAERIYERPRSRFAARFLGACNLVDAVVRARGPGGLQVETSFGLMNAAAAPSLALGEGARCTLAIRPERVEWGLGIEGERGNQFSAVVEERSYTGPRTHIWVRSGAGRFQIALPSHAANRAALGIGEEVLWRVPPESVVILED
ncbi:MAG: ABC transporter ATP-binding protein [Verrucomicrobia bacterium]|nr:ABC transporter ATP-binding protein [Verrucomicrobiota bacterium]